MIQRARAGDALIALLASWSALYPLSTLFSGNAWIRSAMGLSLVVVVVGALCRMFWQRWWVIALVQLLAGLEAFILVHARGHHFYGLPVKDTFLAVNYLLYDARIAMLKYAAPAPLERGVLVSLALITLLFVLAIDVLAVTRRNPAVAGLPLLSAYLITAVNTGSTLHWAYFLMPAALWLILLARTVTSGVRRWATVQPGPSAAGSAPPAPSEGYAAAARVLGATVLAIAVALPLIVPHFPTRFLTDGLGRSQDGSGRAGAFSLSTSLDLARNLSNPSERPVLTYRTTAARPGPLRIALATQYGSDGVFRPRSIFPAQTIEPGQRLSTAIDLTDPAYSPYAGSVEPPREGVMTVRESSLSRPQIALPYGTTVVEPATPDARLVEFLDGHVELTPASPEYVVNFAEVEPTPQLLQESDGLPPGPMRRTVGSETLAVPEHLQPVLREVLEEIVPASSTRLEAAVAIQDWLRSSEFRYSLDLLPATDDGPLPDPIENFLATRQGFCQQFASTMVMLARERGIPARVALGLLPGRLDRGTYQVRASDAHAWPELYFEPFGWVRFEPTPLGRAGTAPDYAQVPRETSTTSSTTSSTTTSPSTTRGPNSEDLNSPDYQPVERSLRQQLSDLPRWAWAAAALVLGLLGALVLPVSAMLARRRRLAAAPDDAAVVEERWRDLVGRIGDLGIATSETMTPRQMQGYLAERGALDASERAALGRVVSAVEVARYAAPGSPLADPAGDIATVYGAIDTSRTASTRVRARLVPSAGVRPIRRLGQRLTGLPTRLLRELRSRRG